MKVKAERLIERALAELRREYADGKVSWDCPPNDDLWNYWKGKLNGKRRREIEEHVFKCPVCFVEFERIRDIVEDMEEIRLAGPISILKMVSGLRRALSMSFKPVYLAKSDELIPAAIMDERGNITDFAIFKVLVHPEIEDGTVSMALREYEDSTGFDGYTAYVILSIDGEEFELLSKVRDAEIVLEGEPLPGTTKKGEISGVELHLRKSDEGR